MVKSVNTNKVEMDKKAAAAVVFENPEFGNVTHWLHYYSSKQVSPFYNSILIKGD